MTSRPLDESKRVKTAQVIGTHNGTFHCDEALAIFMLKAGVPRFEGATVVRSRDPEVLRQATCVVDVGGVYDPDTLRFDHHQREFNEVFSPDFSTKLSSAGLIYKHYGKQVISTLISGLDQEKIDRLYVKLYSSLIEGVDGVDNGIQQYKSDEPARYQISTSLSARVGRMQPRWNQEDQDTDTPFQAAIKLVGLEFVEQLEELAYGWLPGRNVISEVLKNRRDLSSSGRIVALDLYAPWKSHLHELEIEEGLSGDNTILYVIYPDYSKKWRVQAVSSSPGSFESRLPLPEAWRGVRSEELDEVSGIPGCVFVHSSGFIGGHNSKEGALAMAAKSIELDQ